MRSLVSTTRWFGREGSGDAGSWVDDISGDSERGEGSAGIVVPDDRSVPALTRTATATENFSGASIEAAGDSGELGVEDSRDAEEIGESAPE
jgi:hypothetical protein